MAVLKVITSTTKVKEKSVYVKEELLAFSYEYTVYLSNNKEMITEIKFKRRSFHSLFHS